MTFKCIKYFSRVGDLSHFKFKLNISNIKIRNGDLVFVMNKLIISEVYLVKCRTKYSSTHSVSY